MLYRSGCTGRFPSFWTVFIIFTKSHAWLCCILPNTEWQLLNFTYTKSVIPICLRQSYHKIFPMWTLYLQSNKFPSKSFMKIQTDFQDKYLDFPLLNKSTVSLSLTHFFEISSIVVGQGEGLVNWTSIIDKRKKKNFEVFGQCLLQSPKAITKKIWTANQYVLLKQWWKNLTW
jgi:hypothetical protein